MHLFIKTLVAALLLSSVALSFPEGDERPNIILIMADDMGYECVSAYGCLSYKTPFLDKLARSGIKFNNCYAQPVCTPSRVKIMTGRYNFRNYEGFAHLPEDEITFGKQMQEAGYLTCITGKWQLGKDTEKPHRVGFDEYCLLNGIFPREAFDRKTRGSQRYWGYPPIVANGELYESKHTFGPDMINEYAVNFIRKKKDKPFFLYYPMIAPHPPWSPSPLSREGDKSGKHVSEVRFFKDMVEYIDKLVERVVQALEESGQRENTLLIFTGDNGTAGPIPITAPCVNMRRVVSIRGEREWKIVDAGVDVGLVPENKRKNNEIYQREAPLTLTDHGEVPGEKGKITEYGTHVPLIISWPRHEKAYGKHNHECDDLIDFSDFFPTFVELGGGSLPTDREMDGISFASRLRGKGDGTRDYIFCHYWRVGRFPEGALDAIHDTRWKLYSNGDFFDLKKDGREKTPLGDEALDEEAKAARARLLKAYTELRKLPIPNECPTDRKPWTEK